MMFVTDQVPEFVALAAGLLQANLQVTILQFQESSYKQGEALKKLHQQIVSSIPCHHPARTREDALKVVDVTIPLSELIPVDDDNINNMSKCQATSLFPLDWCSIQAAPRTVQVLKNYMLLHDQAPDQVLLGKRPDVLIMDATLVGGLILSEGWGIPTVAVGSHQALKLGMEHDPAWSPEVGSWLGRLVQIVKQRFYSLSLTGPFLELNRMRRDMGLRPLQSPSDYFLPVAALLVEFAPTDQLLSTTTSTTATGTSQQPQQQWQRVHFTGPLQAPCTPCLPSVSPKATRSSNKQTKQYLPNATIVLVVPPPQVTPAWTRAILRGLALARDSLAAYDDCEWDSLTCQKHTSLADFAVVWLSNDSTKDYFPAVVPDYVEREPSVGVLDSLAGHPQTIAVVMHCDSESHVLKRLGLLVVCVSQSERLPPVTASTANNRHGRPPILWEARALAVQLLQQLRRRQQHPEENEQGEQVHSGATAPPAHYHDGLERAVSLVKRVAETYRAHQPWKDVLEMQAAVALAASNTNGTTATTTTTLEEQSKLPNEHPEDHLRGAQQPPYDTFTVLVAWIVVLSSALYVLLKDYLSFWRPARRSQLYSYSSEGGGGIFTRLPDLDDAWATLMEWYRDQPDWVRSMTTDASMLGISNSETGVVVAAAAAPAVGERNNHSSSHHHQTGHANHQQGNNNNLRRRRRR
jgi:hypothetical protein